MARQLSIGHREVSAAEDAYGVYVEVSRDGVISAEDDERMREALHHCMRVADRSDETYDLIRCAIETAMEGRRFERRKKDYLRVIRGGMG